MAGFLSAYSGTTRVEVGDPDSGYWVDLKDHLSQGAKEKGERALQRYQFADGKTALNPDVVESRQQWVLASIDGWNLDDANGQVWPISMTSVKRLPGEVFEQLWEVVDGSNTPRSTEERRQFPAGGVGGDPDADPGPAVPVDVPAEAAVLAAPGDDQV
jgi:hypothetical protein